MIDYEKAMYEKVFVFDDAIFDPSEP